MHEDASYREQAGSTLDPISTMTSMLFKNMKLDSSFIRQCHWIMQS